MVAYVCFRATRSTLIPIPTTATHLQRHRLRMIAAPTTLLDLRLPVKHSLAQTRLITLIDNSGHITIQFHQEDNLAMLMTNHHAHAK